MSLNSNAYFSYAAIALTIGALVHVVGHFMGPETIEFMGAPPDVCLLYTSPSPRD